MDINLEDSASQEPEVISDPVSEKLIQYETVVCSKCNTWFIHILDYLKHHIQHFSDDVAPCLLCTKSFLSKETLINHYTGYHHLEISVATTEDPDDGKKDLPPHNDHSYFRLVDGEGRETQYLAENFLENIIVEAEPSVMSNEGDPLSEVVVNFECTVEGKSNDSQVVDEQMGADLVDEEKDADLADSSFPADAADAPEIVGDASEIHSDQGEEEGSCKFLIEQGGIDNENEDYEEFDKETYENDFRFVSGLRHKKIRIAHTSLMTDIGLQVFICLHCDFIDSEIGLVNHMKVAHKSILELEKSILKYDKRVPPNKVFPENVTGEEVMRLSEYHRRNLQRKAEAKCKKMQSQGKANKSKEPMVKKRYVENRVPCLCPECGKVLCRKSALRTHMLGVHSRSRNHLCEVCGKAFRAANQLSQHRKSHRSKLFTCDLCDFTSDIRTAIFEHQQVHPSKFVLCHVCGTVLKSKTALTRHMMVHSESRPFACPIEGCTWRFKSEAFCKGHIESHTSQGQFVCLVCKRHFRKRHHVRRHLKTVHEMKSNQEADQHITVDSKVMPSTAQYGQIPVTQLSKQHIVITTDEHGTPIICDQNAEFVLTSKVKRKKKPKNNSVTTF